MKLLVDAGNSRIKWGLWDRGWLHQDAFATTDIAQLEGIWSALAIPAEILACNVAGGAIQTSLETWASRRGVRIRWVRSAAEQLGVRNGYREPGQLGPDRWMALIAARRVGPGAMLVVNAGTAVTADALSSAGEFLGGVILPGANLMAQSLSLGTAGLPMVDGKFEEFPVHTADAIATGAIHAVCGAIARMHAALAARGDVPDILLSGGAAHLIETHLRLPVRMVPNIVLEGLSVIALAEHSQ